MSRQHSLSTRLSITTGLVATLLMVGIALYALVLKRNEVMANESHDIDISMTNTALSIDKALSQVEASINSNIWLLRTSDYNSTIEVMDQIITLNKEIKSIGLIFDIDTLHNTRAFMMYMQQGSNVTTSLLPSMSTDPRNRAYEWLRAPLREGAGVWSGPHTDLMGNGAVCTYIVPIDRELKNETVLLFADIPVGELAKIMADDNPKILEESFLLGDDGRCIACVPTREDESHVHRTVTYAEASQAMAARGDSIYENAHGTFDLLIGKKEMPTYYTVINSEGWTLYYVVQRKLIDTTLNRSMRSLVGIFALALLCMYIVLSITIKRIIRPLKKFSDSAIEISKGHFDVQLPMVTTHDEMAQLQESFATMQKSLQQYMHQIEEKTRSEAFIKGELNIASRIQDDLLPKVFPPFAERADIDVYASLIPAKQIGGDLYNYFIRDERLYFIVGDVSGKSVPAAMVMTIACTVFNAVAGLQTDPALIMQELNDTTCANNHQSGFFITALVGVLDLHTGELRVCNAGHDPSILIHPNGEVEVLKLTVNLPVGIQEGYQYRSELLQLQGGSRYVLYTDGITEAENKRHKFYGIERLKSILKATYAQSLRHVIDSVVRSVHDFQGDVEQSDDLTIMMIEYQPSELTLPDMLTITSEIDEITKVKDYIDAVAQALHIDVCTTYKVQLAVEEAVSNIIRHAAKVGKKTINIYSGVHHHKLTVIITDSGKGFDPTLMPDADTSAPLESRQVGGLGITLMRQVTSGMYYRRLNQKNHLTLTFDL